MNKFISRIQNDNQDRNSIAWKKLCEYIDLLAKEQGNEFYPEEVLGSKLYSEIYTLPESIAKLNKVKRISLGSSKLKRIPPQIGQMTSLEYVDFYGSYNLHWYPYELSYCTNLRGSLISTRALYGNVMDRRGFPALNKNPVSYVEDKLYCSVCKKETKYDMLSQWWLSLNIGTDIVPLLVNSCSTRCNQLLPTPSKSALQFPHKGGSNLEQPPNREELIVLWRSVKSKLKNAEIDINKNVSHELYDEMKSSIPVITEAEMWKIVIDKLNSGEISY
ncbi:hypothetical protein MNBD_GAMMA12-2576 [hydrothermal vent metagenome]|uniref:Uncharacterized protein n=1 Tax=hydrothermal vent metagenome TaxID=652676 RepID=A0A3B0Y7R6_9ZZZZ